MRHRQQSHNSPVLHKALIQFAWMSSRMFKDSSRCSARRAWHGTWWLEYPAAKFGNIGSWLKYTPKDVLSRKNMWIWLYAHQFIPFGSELSYVLFLVFALDCSMTGLFWGVYTWNTNLGLVETFLDYSTHWSQ